MAEETKIGIKLEEEMKPLKKICEHLEEAVKAELSKGIESVDAEEMGKVVDMIKDIYEAKEKMVKACYYKQIMEAMEEHDFEDEEEIMDEGRRGYRGQPRSQSGRFMSRGDGRRSNRGRGGRRGYESPMMYDDWDEMQRMSDFEDGRMYYGGSSGSGSSSSGSSSSSGGSGMSGGSSSGMSGGSSGSSGGSRGYSEGGQMSSRMQRDGGESESRYDRARRGYEEAKSMNDTSADGKRKSMENLESYMKELSEDMTQFVGKMDANEKAMVKSKLQNLMTKF